HPVDGAGVTHFQITNIQHGTLFQNDGTTQINDGDFITFAQGNAGLKFTPASGFVGTATFQVQASVSNTAAGLGGAKATASVRVETGATFQDGVNGYSGEADIQLRQTNPNTSYPSGQDADGLLVDWPDSGSSNEAQVLIRFDDLFGSGTGQIASGAR